MRGVSAAFLLLVAVVIAQIAHYYAKLPDPMASHFGFDGSPNGWSSRTAFFAIYLGALLLTAGALFALAGLLTRMPDRAINLPNRDHWLSAERRVESLGYVQGAIGWCAIGVLLFMLLGTQLVIRANLAGGGRLESGKFWWLLGLFACWVILTPVRVYLRMSRVPGLQGSSQRIAPSS
jgi:uncharacterized membrane protein